MPAEVLLPAAVVGAPFVGAVLIAVARLPGRGVRLAAPLGLATATVSALLVAWLWAAVPRPLFWRIGWIDPLGIGLGLYVDDLSLLFAVLVAGVSLLSLLYSLPYIPHELQEPEAGGDEAAYYTSMLLFTGAMLGMVFAADLIQLYVFWELTGVASFLLIGLRWRDPRARYGAVKALLVTAVGGLAMLLGFLLLGATLGTFALPALLAQGEALRAAPAFGLVLVLVLVGAATKSAQVPFHVWLPDAMVAPTPVSAFLHSAALVAAGVYLLARVHPVFAGAPLWQWSVTGVGLASMLVGGLLALKAREFKALLAYSTISQYGFIFALLGYASAGALAAALFSFLQHGLIKAGLFFAAGAVTYATGRKELGGADGLWSKLPLAFAVSAVLALSLGGVAPLAGFWIKEGFLAATLEAQRPGLVALGVVASALTFTYMLRFLAGAFVEGTAASARIQPIPVAMLVAPGVLALLTVLFGLWPDLATRALAVPAARSVVGAAAHLELALHLDLKLLLSVLALGLGAVAFATFRHWAYLVEAVARPRWSLDRLYAGAAASLRRAGQVALGAQNGRLSRYLRVMLLGLLGLLAYPSLSLFPMLPLPALGDGGIPAYRGLLDWALGLLLLLVAVGTVLTFVVHRHVHMVLALSAVGYLIAGVFALELAPDVALVQVHVETLVTVLFILALVFVPRPVRHRFFLRPRERLAGGMMLLAALGGLGSAWLSWLAITHPAADPIAPWFNEHALELAHASDVVAAILVDFRALDTLGEITVFAIAMTGVYALVRLIREEPE